MLCRMEIDISYFRHDGKVMEQVCDFTLRVEDKNKTLQEAVFDAIPEVCAYHVKITPNFV